MSTDSRTLVFEKIPVHRAVLKQVVPAVASQMIALIYNLADTYFVGMLNDPRQTAAITVVYSSFVMLTAISNLFGVGGASVIARALGKKQNDQARQVASISFWLGLAAACLFSVVFLIFAHPVLFLCGATEETFPVALGYAKWVVVFGGPFVIMNTLLANLVRAEGSAVHASIGVSLGGIVNVILDPFFVLPQFLGLGAIGAGMATAVSNLIAVAYFVCLILGKRRGTVVNLRVHYLRHIGEQIKPILSVGFPSALQYALTVVAVGAQSRFVAKYTTEAMAALGIVKKLDQLPLYFSIGVANGLLPLLAYNYASGNQERRRRAFRFGCIISAGFSLFCLVLYELFASQLSSFFIQDPLTIQYSAAFLRRMVTAMPFMAFCYPMIIQFQAMGKVKEALITSVLRKGVLDIPLLFLMDGLFPLYGCMWVQPIVDFVSLMAAAAFYRRIKERERAVPSQSAPS